MSDSTPQMATLGVIGMATMGRNLARNLARHGYSVAVYNRSRARTDTLISEHGDEGSFIPAFSIPEFVASLQRPRTVIIMVQAGAGTDAVIDEIQPLLEPGDVCIDAGNAHFADTNRREAALTAHGIHFVGMGVSGGEEGALLGPSIMPGGSAEAYTHIGPIMETIAAQVNGEACCVHVGTGGAGHFVKMVHNGIEYADMQLIAEAYDLLRTGLGWSSAQIAEVFRRWNESDLESYLIEITADILDHTDPVTGQAFVDIVKDSAEQKGTGRWTVQSALDLGVPVTGIAEATFARAISGSGTHRAAARAALVGDAQPWQVDDSDAFVADVRAALYASKVVAYSQGFDQIQAASEQYGWNIDRAAVARIWRGGCIIRARFLDRISDAYIADPELPLLMAAPAFRDSVTNALGSWRRTVAAAAIHGLPAPTFAASLAYYDAIRAERLPAALIQAQRDYFGAHTYERVDQPGYFHTLWAGDRSQVAG